MPLHEYIVNFSKELVKYLDDYEIVSEHIPSRVVMFARKKYNVDGVWMTWIDYPKWDELADQDPAPEEFWKKTPQVGLSGKGTIDNMPEHVKERISEDDFVFVDEQTQEIDLD